MQHKHILIAGGAGFLGSHLCQQLLSQGHRISCLDNLHTGRIDNIQALMHNQNFQFIEHDIIHPIDIQADEIYNLACPASPIHYQDDSIHTLKTCVNGNMNLLELAKKYHAKILLASTSEVYGDPDIHPQPEHYWGNVNPIGKRACYDEGKRCAETFFFNYHREYKIPIKVIRIFNTYGPRMLENDGRVISNFTIQALQNHPITIYGDGSQTRSLCYVDDLIDGMIRMMNSDNNLIGPINLGNPQERTVLDIAKQIIQMTGSQSKIIYQALPEDDPRRRKPDISKAKQLLSWTPSTDFVDGLQKTIDYFQENTQARPIRKSA